MKTVEENVIIAKPMQGQVRLGADLKYEKGCPSISLNRPHFCAGVYFAFLSPHGIVIVITAPFSL